MNFNKFPTVYEYQRREEQQEYIKRREKYVSDTRSQKNSNFSKNRNEVKLEKITFSKYISLFTIVFTIIGAVFEIICTIKGIALIMNDSSNYGLAGILIYAAYGAGAGAGIACILWPVSMFIIKAINSNKQKRYDSTINSLRDKTDKEISQVENSVRKEIATSNKNLDDEIEEYKVEFDKQAQLLSIDYANSVIAKEVIEWLTSGFLRTIKAAKRDSHIETVKVPFNFQVFRDSIKCNIGTYGFTEHRCAPLKDAVGQAALSRAIASQVQLNIIMSYPQDESGTKFEIKTDYQYPIGSRLVDEVLAMSVTLTYIASNGNFKPIQNW